ncbi:Outer membrane protein TolC precursor [Gemmata obscuriglobus]|nr:TolC family protein [Gemmata obscuriglobus]QEG29399.1 Outer membrane protein TolC precursor [Gemmata obscuriglobus]VTS08471.1 outer membrane efflux protein : Outer membrane efflux protein OS=Thermosinus carboxydivorans Nor1 GN=TcarDRAFT_1490 PE=4 SV=1: OEP: OEP [Gemmata obscuriglobus UQM 2246]
MRHVRAAAVAVLGAAGCLHSSATDPGGAYAARVTAPQVIPKEYDPVVPPAGSVPAPHETGAETSAPLDQPLTLEQAEDLALRHSPRIAEARWAATARQAGERSAQAAFLPTVGTSYAFQGYSSHTGFVGVPDGGRFPVLPVRGFGPGNQDFEVLDLRVQWTVFQFGKRLAARDQAHLRAEIAQWQWERTRQSVAFDVAVNYARVLQARAAQVVAERAVVRAEASLKDVRNLAQNGVLTNEDVLRAEVFLAEVRQGLVTATSESQIAVAGLNRVMGVNVSSPTRVVERSAELDDYSVRLEDCLAQAVAGRPEFSVVRLGVAAAGRGTDVVRADFLPTIAVSGGGALVEGSRVQNSQVADAGIALKWDLYTGGRRRAELDGAQAEVEVALAQGQQVCDTIAFETHVAYRNIEDAVGRLKLSRSAVGQAIETLRLVRNRYNRGDAKPTDVVDAETALIRAEQNLNAARYDLLVALARMKFATGGAPQPTAPSKPSGDVPAPRPVEKK